MKIDIYPIIEDALYQIRLALIKLQAAQKELEELKGRYLSSGFVPIFSEEQSKSVEAS